MSDPVRRNTVYPGKNRLSQFEENYQEIYWGAAGPECGSAGVKCKKTCSKIPSGMPQSRTW